ncbi:MAG: class I SAM-dependent methyltransferase [Ktedonobacterales bacterium]|nr:class I SAM-dependent methyltransferase [Ktedonobacterales bacterium]
MSGERDYYQRLAAAYVRGALAGSPVAGAHPDLFTPPLDELAASAWTRLVALGEAEGLRLHRFKRTMGLPRVRKVLGMLRGVQPTALLDIGSGRGAALWPMVDAFPTLPITCVDTLAHREADIERVRAGGVTTLTAMAGDATRLPFADGAFDVVTLLEVLEHIPDTRAALTEVCRVTGRYLVLSAPSRPDNNPEHIHLFNEPTLARMLREAGMHHTGADFVLNHLLIIARR